MTPLLPIRSFEEFYASFWQHPLSLWLTNLIGTSLALMLIRLRPRDPEQARLRAFVLLWAAISAMDAWLTSNEVAGLGGPLPSALAGIVPLFFVIIGDLRVFWALERWGCGAGPGRGPAALKIAAASLIVPIWVYVLGLTRRDPRVLFLVYELSFLLWIWIYSRSAKLRPRGDARAEAFTKSLVRYVLFYYGLWAAADAWILATDGAPRDLGFALRVIPNWLYYGTWGLAVARACSPSGSTPR